MRVERFALLWVLSGCVGTEIGNPQDGEAVLRVMSGEALSRASELHAAGFVLDDVTMSLTNVRFKKGSGGERDANAEGLARLVRGGEFETFDLGLGVPHGVYRSIKVKVSPSGEDVRPRMEGLSLRMVGRRADGVEVVLEEDRSFMITAKSEAGDVSLEEGRPNVMFLVVDVGSWFEGAELDQLEPGEDGVVRINRGENRKVLNSVRQRVRKSVSVGHDADEDGQPSVEELEGFDVGVSE